MSTKSGFIDLGKKSDMKACCEPAPANSVYYPQIYISNVKGLDLDTGDVEFSAKGRVVSVTENKREGSQTYSCEIEVHSIKVLGGESSDLGSALNKIASKKSK